MAPARALSSRWLGRVFNIERSTPTSELPLYLCPAFRSLSREPFAGRRQCNAPRIQARRLHTQPTEVTSTESSPLTKQPTKTLPLQCHGCGALSQTTVPNEAGYYDVSRKVVRQYLGLLEEKEHKRASDPDQIIQKTLQAVDVDALERQGINLRALLPERAPEQAAPTVDKPPLCDRCHTLIHHSAGNSIYHPSIESLRDTIEESPYKNNHVYHVLDAADFPMSLLSRLHSLLDITLRTQNRRAKPVKFQHGRRMDMSFIISRSDLLAPKKEQVDSLMPYLKETLRQALGRVGGRIRLGNVHCVSAKRSWWTKELKEEIWNRGGAGWMVGKANVGKSQLFEAVFPKGRMDWEAPKHQISVKVFPQSQPQPTSEQVAEEHDTNPLLPGRIVDPTEEFSLLPPPRPETNYPEMPVVSSLPGTTASPIRVPFGNGRGELIDLPGLARNELEFHVLPEKRPDLIMKSRVLPEQQVLRPGQSLLLGGFIRLTPRNVGPQDDELIFLAYAFTPIAPHLTATNKAVAVQTQAEDAPNVENIAVPGTGAKTRHAGAFQVRYDVTKARTGPITSKVAVGLKVDRLPYRVLGIDILIEGCGWVEVAVQVRTKQLYPHPQDLRRVGAGAGEGGASDTMEQPLQRLDLRPEPINEEKKKEGKREGEMQPKWPVIDVYSPEGKFIGYRPPMNAWVLNKPKKETKSRPRKSMKGVKKMEKAMRRAKESTE
ncbi:hypothetical protein N657DRAFT_647256 [Parathielavia appendiculata]|uniref:Genetic interactor of prohibitins 3, mitochondrial n=1 Tax=Parathielavia appendiculata TaxID=2587402 RepID=A0AAN6TW78_9PEZI|nr:hypothetical protein N657DRAFT_647256 [Parathielavia appendiculata]